MNNDPIPIQQAQSGALAPRKVASQVPAVSPFGSVDSFKETQRMAQLLASSSLVPQGYQGNSANAIANCVLALDMALRTRSNPLMVMQNLLVVHGKPSWSGQWVIAAINQSGRFAEPLHFEFEGAKGSDEWGCRAVTVTNSGKEIKGPLVTIGLAKAEGWYSRNPKWKNMPELMLRYRAGSWFGRTECPELLMGMPTQEEVIDGEYIEVDRETGEVLSEPQTVEQVRTPPERAAGEDDEGEAADTQPMTDQERMAQLEEHGFYEEGEGRFFNAAGDRWDPEVHATSRDGKPVINQDGSFRARRGTANPAQDDAGEQPEQAGSDNGSPEPPDDEPEAPEWGGLD